MHSIDATRLYYLFEALHSYEADVTSSQDAKLNITAAGSQSQHACAPQYYP